MNANSNPVDATVNFQSNMFGAKLAGYYTDDDGVKEEIEAQSYPIETRANGKRVRIIEEDPHNLATQTSIPVERPIAKPRKSSNKKKSLTNVPANEPPI
jgi:hypothetical protein